MLGIVLIEFDLAPITVELNSYCACAIGIYFGTCAKHLPLALQHSTQNAKIAQPVPNVMVPKQPEKELLVHPVVMCRHFNRNAYLILGKCCFFVFLFLP